MRMWMVDPSIMCTRHLLGEHVEHHMFMGSLRKGVSLQGYADGNLLELESLLTRHAELAKEMARRGMNHKSQLVVDFNIQIPSTWVKKIDRELALIDLIGRCQECRCKYELLKSV